MTVLDVSQQKTVSAQPVHLKNLAVIIISAAAPMLALRFTIGPWLKEGFGGFRGLYFSIEFAIGDDLDRSLPVESAGRVPQPGRHRVHVYGHY